MNVPAPARPRTPGRLRVFFGGQVISLLGDGLAILAIPLMVLELTGDPLPAALAAVPRTLGYVLVGLPGGVLVDRVSPHRLMLVTDLVRIALFLIIPVLSWAGLLQVWMLLGLAFVAAAAGVLFECALTVAVQDLVPPDRLVRANGLLEQANQAAIVLGPGIVGVLAAVFDLRIALLGNALTFAVSFCSLLVLSDWTRSGGVRPDRSATRSPGAEFAAGLRYLVRNRLVLGITTLQAVVNLCLAALTLLVFHLKITLGLSAAEVSVVVACGGIGGFTGASLASLLAARMRPTSMITLGVLVAGPALGALGLVDSVPLLGAGYLVVMAAVISAGVAIRAVRQTVVPRALLGRVTSTGRVIALATNPLGAVVFGALIGATGGNSRPLFLVAGAVLAVAGGVFLGKARALTAEPAGQKEEGSV